MTVPARAGPVVAIDQWKEEPVEPKETLSVDEMDLSDIEGFWTLPLAEREGAFATLRRERPVAFFEEPDYGFAPKGPGYWAITRYADVVAASRAPERFCSGRGSTSIPDLPPEFLEYYGGMINADDPRHARLRRIVSRAFTPKRLHDLEGSVQRVAAQIVDQVADRGSCDFVAEIAAALPLRIICEMMGVPPSQYGYVLERTNVILGPGDPEYVAEREDIYGALLTAGVELGELVTDLGRTREAHPTDDVTSALVNAEIDGERLSFDELASFFILLVVAGNETTRNAISWGLVLLDEHPDQRAAWAADFEGLAPSAVEEIVRVATPVIQMRRTVTADTTLGGQQLSAGDKVLLFYNSANRDEAVFDEPYRVDLSRAENRHVGFGGYGPHFCLGAHLARREITVLFREVLSRLPDIQVTGEPDRLRSNFINGIKHLPVSFSTPR
ncbi:MAG TPA: cytochrome P450 [Acidimicrobiales bacterium]|nr:cytochrome P450 [Acidimicrobiales bacterium]